VTVSLSELIRPLIEDEQFAGRMAAFYARVDEAVALHRPTCWNRGACCKFGTFGHRLYVTTAELAYFVHGKVGQWRPVTGEAACPYQEGGLCTAREHRPLGCRIFFCDPAAQAWQPGEYERFLRELKAIGEEAGLEYQYREWLSALAEAGPEGHAGVQEAQKTARCGVPTGVALTVAGQLTSGGSV
jgi:Fe-S-cluster containining protein